MEVTRALAGHGIEAADFAPDMRRLSIVKAGLWRHKLMARAWGTAGLTWAAASLAMSPRAAWMPPIVVGRNGPSTSRVLLCLAGNRERHLFNAICAARGLEIVFPPPSKNAPHALGQHRTP